MQKVLSRVLSVGENRPAKKYQKLVDRVLDLEGAYSDLTDEELREQTQEFRERFREGETLEALLPEAFAVVREAASRVLGQNPYPVQVLGAVALFKGNVAQMKTGEGKTLVATMPAYLEAISGEAVHIVTVNEYLATYQSELMGRVFRALDVSVGCIVSGQGTQEKQDNYSCDVVYGTSSEFGFDYLRDNMETTLDRITQRGLNYAIIDEVDSILMDEALTPLLIAAPGNPEAGRDLQNMAKAARGLRDTVDYKANAKQQTVSITEEGVQKIEKALRIENIFSGEHARLVGLMYNAVKAKALFHRDKDYITRNGAVEIVDRETGRVLEGRRFSEGLHQAIEAKEGIKINPEDVTAASVSLQNFFRLYSKLSGMTGTAKSESGELMEIYKLHTVEIPTNKPSIRLDRETRYFTNEEAKLAAVIDKVKEVHFISGQPILIGTGSVAKSEKVSKRLRAIGIEHNVLNAKNNSREASIVAEAGRKNAITVATNMAGRGTDIILGGNPETLAVDALNAKGLDPQKHPEEYEAAWEKTYPALVASSKEAGQEIANLGGLLVISTERYESKRVDDQLRGRAGRQGDPGESQFFCSLEDELIIKYNPRDVASMVRIADPATGEIPSKQADAFFDKVQATATSNNRQMRTDTQKYDEVIDRARRHVYAQRRTLIEAEEDTFESVNGMRERIVERFVNEHVKGVPTDEDIENFMGNLASLYPSTISVEDILEEMQYKRTPDATWINEELQSDSTIVLNRVHEKLGADTFNTAVREILLASIDEHWAEYIANMEVFLDGVNFYAMAQQEPVQAFRLAANEEMKRMQINIEENLVRELMYLGTGNLTGNKAYSIEKIEKVSGGKFTAKKNAPTPKRKRNNSAITNQVAFDSGIMGREMQDAFDEGPEDGGPMNRAERRAAERRKKKKGR